MRIRNVKGVWTGLYPMKEIMTLTIQLNMDN